MSAIDWIVLFGTLIFIVVYGIYKTRGSKNIEGYLRADNSMKWWTIGLSVMATQASAITFLSTPGQAYEDGMRFVQTYFGLPLAMVIVAATFVPIYYRLKVYTAYEYLENRFDLKTRILAAFLFLLQRGLQAGITIYAPSIILSTVLDWDLRFTILLIGAMVIVYTVSGGTKAVSQTQKYQMAVMMGGMLIAGFTVVALLPDEISFGDALNVAGNMGKMNVVNLSFSMDDRYNIWSGIAGGLFLALSYFGCDQSQVQRYLSGSSVKESRLGLLMNGFLKIPMQFIILFIGVMVFVFYQFYQPPVFFNEVAKEKVEASEFAGDLSDLEAKYQDTFNEKRSAIVQMLSAIEDDEQEVLNKTKESIASLQQEEDKIRSDVKDLVVKANSSAETTDTDYVFITFVMQHLPKGLVGLLFAVIFSAAMSSTASELNALATTTAIDIYKRTMQKTGSERHYLIMSKYFTVLWGCLAIAFASFASLLDNLIEFINILGSIFYGTILGIFLTAFYVRYIQSNAVFLATLVAQAIVILLFFQTDIGFLWYNVIGCALVVLFAFIFQKGINLSSK